MRDQRAYLSDVLEAIADITDFAGSMTHDEFMNDRKTQGAVLHRFQIIGEAVSHIAPQVKQQYPNISWRDIAGMRNIIVHEYFGVDLELVWDTIQLDLPNLKSVAEELLKKV